MLENLQAIVNAKYSRSSRISGAKDFKRLFKRASRIRGHNLTLLYHPNDLQHGRLGFAVSNKHAGSVVQKNKVKRHVREYFRHYFNSMPLDLVVISKPGIGHISSKEIESNLKYFQRKLEHLKRPAS